MARLGLFINFTLLIFNSGGQVQTVDISDPQTVEGTAITGDTPYTAFDKVNLSLLYLGLLASNNAANLTTVSNTVNGLAPGLAFQGLEIYTNNLVVAWCQHEILSLSANPVGSEMNFDSGQITSDGSGNASFVSLYAQQLKDSGGSTGSAANFAQANGTGGWSWTAWPTTLNYDSGNLTSDGAGDLTVGQNLAVNGSFSSDSGQFYSDGSGNVTAQTFNPVSDRALKEQITPLAPSDALAMTLGLTNYSWRFKAHTNFTASVIPAGTRMVTTNFVARGTNTIMVCSTNKTTVAITNLTPKVFPPSGREFGPMAQDWHSATGLQDGHKISATSEAGLLIGAVQGLASLQNIFTNTAGARFALVVNAQTNGFIFVPLP